MLVSGKTDKKLVLHLWEKTDKRSLLVTGQTDRRLVLLVVDRKTGGQYRDRVWPDRQEVGIDSEMTNRQEINQW